MRLRLVIAGSILALGTEASACRVAGGGTDAYIDQMVLFIASAWAIGVLATLGHWLFAPSRRAPITFLALSCLIPIAATLMFSPRSGDCGTTAVTVTVLWLIGQLAFLSWKLMRRPRVSGPSTQGVRH